MRARYYNPAVGRFTSADPLRQSPVGEKGDFQFYVYTGNDPVNQTDPSGQLTLKELNVALAGFAAIDAAVNAYDSTGSLWKAGAAGLAAFVAGLLIPAGIGKLAALGTGGFVAATTLTIGGVGLASYNAAGDVQTLGNSDTSTLGKVGAGLDLIFNVITLAQVGRSVLKFGSPKVTGAVSPDQQQALDFVSQVEGGLPIDETVPRDSLADSDLEIGPDPNSDQTVDVIDDWELPPGEIPSGTVEQQAATQAQFETLATRLASSKADVAVVVRHFDFSFSAIPSSSEVENQFLIHFVELEGGFQNVKEIIVVSEVAGGPTEYQVIDVSGSSADIVGAQAGDREPVLK
jgi:hypothetical protein